jgi:ABC-type nitrate/sulfonate/bicarbonate transport system substrate-binding protein
VNTGLAQSRPEIVTAFLRATIKAGRWINAHPEAAATILHRVTFYPSVADTARAIAGYDFVPSLSPKNLAGIEITKQFLREHGYISKDFDVAQWVDHSFLEQALKSF